MRVLAFVSSKGGSGKSTLAACIAAVAAEANTVVTVDTDEQGSLEAWGRRRATQNIVHVVVKPAGLEELVRRLRASKTQVCIVDTAGIQGPGAILATRVADMILIPVRPTLTDLDAVRVTVKAIEVTSKPFAFVVSQVPGASPERAKEAARALRSMGRVAPVYTTSRVAYADALASGMGVTEADPKSRASDETRRLWAWITLALGKPNAAVP